MVGIRHQRAQVLSVRHAVVVVIVVAEIADLITVGVQLARVGHQGTHILPVHHAVVVVIVVAEIADPIGVGVQLARVGHQGTHILPVHHAVVVVIRVPQVALPVPIQIRAVVVGQAVRLRTEPIEAHGAVVASVAIHVAAGCGIRGIGIGAVEDPIVVDVSVQGVTDPVPVEVRGPLVDEVIAVVVDRVTDLGVARIYVGFTIVAIVTPTGDVPVPVVVGVGAIVNRIVGIALITVDETVEIDVLNTIGNTAAVGIGETRIGGGTPRVGVGDKGGAKRAGVIHLEVSNTAVRGPWVDGRADAGLRAVLKAIPIAVDAERVCLRGRIQHAVPVEILDPVQEPVVVGVGVQGIGLRAIPSPITIPILTAHTHTG